MIGFVTHHMVIHFLHYIWKPKILTYHSSTASIMTPTALTRDVSDEEIKETLFSIGDDKAPGPVGFSSNFYKKA